MSEKRDKIYTSALKLFSAMGIQAAPTAQIAKEAGVSNGTLFHYFGNKENLVNSLAEHILAQRNEVVFASLMEDRQIKDQIRKIWEQRIAWAINNPDHHRFLLQFQTVGSKDEVWDRKFTQQFIDLVETGIRLNMIGFMPGDYIHTMFEANVDGMINYLMLNPVKFRTPEFMKQSFEWYWNSVKNHAYQHALN